MSKKDLSYTSRDFPMLNKKMNGKPLIYFDNAATSHKPRVMIDTMTDFYQNQYGTVNRAVYELVSFATTKFQDARILIQKFLNASRPEEIIFTNGTTDSINMIAYSFGKAFIQTGDEIIISEIEHHANIVPWQMLCEERDAVLKFIPVDDRGVLDLEQYRKLLSPKTKIVAIAHVSNALGTVHPIKQIIEWAHEVGAKVLVDGAQAAPHIKIDVQDLDADFYVFSGHKTFGPNGVGVLYGKYHLLDQLPPFRGGGDMIESVTLEKTTYQKPPLKFEAGTPPIAQVLGLGRAIEYLNALGMDRIHAWEMELLDHATKKLEEIPGLSIMGTAPDKSALISFNIEGIHPLDLGTLL
ncbi:MAG: putative cysteine desulfurase, partial [Chlamydiae bacterium]|nr:putative cysteine desulfurase [Chlamydiota bacterium]